MAVRAGRSIQRLRKRLIRLLGQRCQFRARFMYFGEARVGKRTQRYMLIEDVVDMRGRHITKHLWMPLRAKDYVYTPLWYGDMIQFEAEIERYTKGGKKHPRMDYGLCKPTDVQRIEQFEMEQEA